MFEPCQASKKHLFGSILGAWFGVKCRSWKRPFQNTSLEAQMPTWRPPLWFLGPEWGPIWRQTPQKWRLGMHPLTFWNPKVAPRRPKAPKFTQNGSQNRWFWDAMLNDMSSMTKNKLSNRHQIMPTSTKKTHTTQRGVGGMRRRPGKFWIRFRSYLEANAAQKGSGGFVSY